MTLFFRLSDLCLFSVVRKLFLVRFQMVASQGHVSVSTLSLRLTHLLFAFFDGNHSGAKDMVMETNVAYACWTYFTTVYMSETICFVPAQKSSSEFSTGVVDLCVRVMCFIFLYLIFGSQRCFGPNAQTTRTLSSQPTCYLSPR